MEEVWKDINVSSSIQVHHTKDEPARTYFSPSIYHQQNHNSPHHQSTLRGGINLQEFLARPFSRDPPSSSGTITSAIEFGHFGSSVLPTPPASLGLNSGIDQFHYMDNTTSHNTHRPLDNNNSHLDVGSSTGASLSSPFDAFPSFCNKTSCETEDSTGDRRHKRMIKNREAATRSRARKQSYTNELELKVAYLTKENQRLMKQQQELHLAAAAQLPKKASLQRTSTAPF